MENKQSTWDIVIVGAGAAGLSAGIFAARRGLKTLILTKEVGGQTATTYEIENYPGIEKIGGPALIQQMRIQAEHFGCEFMYADLLGVVKNDNGFALETSAGVLTCLSLIAASGKKPRILDLPNEASWYGKGVYYSSADIDAQKIKDNVVVVVGGGSAALQEAMLYARTAKKVYVIHRRSSFRAEDILIKRVREHPVIELITDAQITSLEGEESLSAIHYEQKGDLKIINTNVLSVKIGYDSDTTIFSTLLDLDSQSRIVVDHNAHTSLPGFFAAGDITNVDFAQIVISAGDGAKAGLSAYFYIMTLKGEKGTKADWGYL